MVKKRKKKAGGKSAGGKSAHAKYAGGSAAGGTKKLIPGTSYPLDAMIVGGCIFLMGIGYFYWSMPWRGLVLMVVSILCALAGFRGRDSRQKGSGGGSGGRGGSSSSKDAKHKRGLSSSNDERVGAGT